MNSWLFSRSVGAGRATTRKTRGLTRSVMALIVPPLPAASRPSNRTMAFAPSALTQSCSRQSSTWSLCKCFSYSLRFILLEFELSLMLTTYASGTAKQSMGKWRDRSNLFAASPFCTRSQKECPMADVKAQKSADPLAALPTAKEVMEQIALKEAEKASAAANELSAAAL